MILRCNCRHKFQDREYGNGLRVHNPCKGKDGALGHWRCTVCGNARQYSSPVTQREETDDKE